jgi:hypothetical protein
MKRFVALCLIWGPASAAFGQYPMYGQPPGWNPYMTRAEALAQQRWQNEQWLRQQQAWEKANPERNETLDWIEQTTRARANKQKERYYRNLNRQMEQENPFYPKNNPFMQSFLD